MIWLNKHKLGGERKYKKDMLGYRSSGRCALYTAHFSACSRELATG